MRWVTSPDAGLGALEAGIAVTASTVATTASTTTVLDPATSFTTAAPAHTSKRFPAWAIAAIVLFIVMVILFGLSYQFNLFCFQLLHRYRQQRAYHRRYGTTGIGLPSVEALAAMGRGLRPNAHFLPPDSAFADPAEDIVVYRRAPLGEGGGHHWIPYFPRMYNRVNPEGSRGLFVALHELHGEVLLSHSLSGSLATTAEAEEDRDSNCDDGDSCVFVPNPSRDHPSPEERAFANAASPLPAAETASPAEEALVTTPSAIWMTAGIPLRSYITAYLTDPLHYTIAHPSRHAAQMSATIRTAAASTSSFALEGTTHARRRDSRVPAPTEGVATVPNDYRAPTHMFFPLAQYCDLRQWHLVDRPEASLGAVRVYSIIGHADVAAAAARQQGDGGSMSSESVEFDVPSDVLYGSGQYKKNIVSALPESHAPIVCETYTEEICSPSRASGNRLCDDLVDEFTNSESEA